MKQKLFSILALLSLFTTAINPLLAQGSLQPVFQVIHLPRKLEYDRDKLNKEIAPINNKALILQLLKMKNFETADVVLLIQKDHDLRWWTINTGTWAEWEDDHIIMQSKDAKAEELYSLADFKAIFKDTLILIDTFSVGMYIHSKAYPDDEFYINLDCPDESSHRNQIPLTGGKLIIEKNLLMPCGQDVIGARIFNSENPDRSLATFFIGFLTDEQKELLLALGNAYIKTDPTKGIDDVASFLSDYFRRDQKGSICYTQLVDWLKINLHP